MSRNEKEDKCTIDVTLEGGRNVSLDALRCLLMFLIVLHHSAFHGYWKDDTTLWLLPYLFTTLIFWHVDGFLAISGWFGVRFTLVRFFRLFGVMVFYSIIRTCYLYFVLHVPIYNAIGISGGWYGNTYLAFMFLAPLINPALDRIVALPKKKAFLIWVIYDIGVLLNWAPYNLFSGVLASGGGCFSIMTFLTVYVNVRLLKIFGFDSRFTPRIFLLICMFYVMGTVIFSVSWAVYQIVTKGATQQWSWVGYTTYNSPHAILMAVAVLLAFVKFVHIPFWIGKVVSWVTPSMWGVYLLHSETLVGRKLFEVPERFFAETTSLSPLVIVYLAAVFTFSVCTVVDSVRRMMVLPIDKFITSKLKLYDSKLAM